MALNFPASPTLDQIYAPGELSWKWDGTTWKSNSINEQLILTGNGSTSVTGTFPNLTVTSNDEFDGTVTFVGLIVPTGLSVSGSPVTNSGNLTITYSSGYSIPTTSSQNTWDYAVTHSNSAYLQANTSDQKAVTSGSYANAAYTQANTANTNAATADQRAVTSGLYANAAYTQANTASVNAISAGSYANGAYIQANTSTINAATADQRAVTSGLYANAAYTQANTATTNAATADQKAVSAGVYANAAFSTANTKYNSSGGTISGDVNITGNLNVVGATITHSANSFVINDPLVLLANNNPGNVLDTGFISHYVEGGVTKHTGLVRDSSANTYYLFDSYVPHLQETNIIDPNEATLRITTLRSNLVSDLVLVRGYDVVNHTNNSYTQANTATTNAATADQRAVTSGVYANSAFGVANTASVNATSAGVYANASFSAANNRVLRSGDAMTGALSTTGNVFAQVLYANTEFYAGIATYSATLLPNALGQFTGNSNTYIQVNQQNIDPQGTSDYVLTSDVGNDTSFYVDLGITNSQYNNQFPNNSLGTSVSPLDGYLVVKGSSINQLGGNLVIGTTSTEVPTEVRVIVGGINEQNVVSKFTQTGLQVNGTVISTQLRQTSNTVRIGQQAGSNTQGAQAVAIGYLAGENAQGSSSVAIGDTAGQINQGPGAIAIGDKSGRQEQGENAIAIGSGSPGWQQLAGSIVIGYRAGYADATGVGLNSIAIGTKAAYTSAVNNSITLNASGIDLSPANSGLYVNPVRNDTGSTAYAIYYNITTKELTYAPAGGGSFNGGTITNPLIINNANASNSNTTGALQVTGGVGVSGNVNIGSNLVIGNNLRFGDGTTQTTAYPPASLLLAFNDVSNQTNGLKSVFALKVDQNSISSIDDSKNLEVIVDGKRLAHYVNEQRYPWITPYDSYKGFRVVSRGTAAQSVVIYNAPAIGSELIITQINTSSNKQTRKYPYSATTIALGD